MAPLPRLAAGTGGGIPTHIDVGHSTARRRPASNQFGVELALRLLGHVICFRLQTDSGRFVVVAVVVARTSEEPTSGSIQLRITDLIRQ